MKEKQLCEKKYIRSIKLANKTALQFETDFSIFSQETEA